MSLLGLAAGVALLGDNSKKRGAGLVLPGNREVEMVAFENMIVAFFVDTAGILGMPKSVAAIYGIVFASPDPLSFADIESRLNLSKGSVSQGLRMLRELGALKEVSRKEDVAERFEPDMRIRKLVSHFLEDRIEKQLDAGKTRLAELQRMIPAAKSGGATKLRERLKHLQGSHAKARALMPIARTFLNLGG